jgi:hypothetical protein
MIEVELPDGRVLEIDTDDATVAATAARKFITVKEGPSVGADVAKSAGIGIAKGGVGLVGSPGDLTELGAMGIDKAVTGVGKLFGQDWSRSTAMPNAKPLGNSAIGSAAIQRGVENFTGEFYKPQTTAGEYAQTIGEFLPAAAAGPGGIARRVATRPRRWLEFARRRRRFRAGRKTRNWRGTMLCLSKRA